MFRPALAAALALAIASPAWAQVAVTPAPAPAPTTPIVVKPVGTLDGWLQCNAAATAVGAFLNGRLPTVADPAQKTRMAQQLQALATIAEGSRQGAAHMNKTAKLPDAEVTRRRGVFLAEFNRPDGLRSAAGVLDACQVELAKHIEPATPTPPTKK